MASATNDLGAFLKARRNQIDPTDLGLARGQRRTPGLRREEVATHAGIGVDYLARLEQGRADRPSSEVVDALARALRLDGDAHRHLRTLAGIAAPPRRRGTPARSALVEALNALAPQPAYLLSRTMDLVAATPAARALLGPIARDDARPNIVRSLFLDPGVRPYLVDWEADTANAVAHLRAGRRAQGADPDLDALVDELSEASADFVRLWADHAVQPCGTGFKHHIHPSVGAFTIAYESFVSWDEDTSLVLYRPAGDERSRTAFDLLTRVTI